MKNTLTRMLAIMLALTLLLSLCACGSNGTSGISSTEVQSEVQNEPAQENDDAPPAGTDKVAGSQVEETSSQDGMISPTKSEALISWPLDDTVTLSFMMAVLPFLSNYTDSLNDFTVVKEIEEKTNVHIDPLTVAAGEDSTQFLLMVASGDYTDLLSNLTTFYPSGGDGAYEDDVALDILDYSDYCPNLMGYYNNDSTVHMELTTAEGHVVYFPTLYSEPVNKSDEYGIAVRSDWLDALELEVPTTLNEFHDVLKQFNENYGATYTLTANSFVDPDGYSQLLRAYNTVMGLYVADDKVINGYLDDGMKDYLVTVHQLWDEGLIYRDFTSGTGLDFDPSVALDGTLGFADMSVSQIDSLNSMMTDGGVWTGLKPLVLNKGDKWLINGTVRRLQNKTWSITTNCQTPEIAVAYSDFYYSPDIFEMWNYGIEGEGLVYNDAGEPVLSDLILNNPSGMANISAQTIYATSPASGLPGVYDYNKDYATYSEIATEAREKYASKETIDVESSWSEIPEAVLSLISSEDQTAYNSIMGDIDTVIAENILKFITGERDLKEYDDFRAQLIEMGIEDAIAIYQKTYEVYQERLTEFNAE